MTITRPNGSVDPLAVDAGPDRDVAARTSTPRACTSCAARSRGGDAPRTSSPTSRSGRRPTHGPRRRRAPGAEERRSRSRPASSRARTAARRLVARRRVQRRGRRRDRAEARERREVAARRLDRRRRHGVPAQHARDRHRARQCHRHPLRERTGRSSCGHLAGRQDWRDIAQLPTFNLPDGQTDGWFRDSDGTVHVLTRHLTLYALVGQQVSTKLVLRIITARRLWLKDRSFIAVRMTLSAPARVTGNFVGPDGSIVPGQTIKTPTRRAGVTRLAGADAHHASPACTSCKCTRKASASPSTGRPASASAPGARSRRSGRTAGRSGRRRPGRQAPRLARSGARQRLRRPPHPRRGALRRRSTHVSAPPRRPSSSTSTPCRATPSPPCTRCCQR